MNAKNFIKKHGFPPEVVICQFYEKQHRRCPVCGNEVELWTHTTYDRVSGLVFCRGCYLLLANIRAAWGPRLEWIMAMVRNERAGNSE